jgi:ketosteroid isomerase-like protein
MGQPHLPGDKTARIESARRLYAAVNAGDIEAAIELMSPDVDWANAVEGGRGCGHDALRSTWGRVTKKLTCDIEVLWIKLDGRGRVVAEAEVLISNAAGDPLAYARARHIFTFRDGLIRRLDVREPPPVHPGG